MIAMELSIERTLANAPGLIARFEQLVAPIPRPRKGVLSSEMFFLYCAVQQLRPGQIVESGRAQAQSTLILSLCFPDVPIVSIERDPDSEDVPIAAARLAERPNVTCLFGDARALMPRLVRPGDVVLIDGPKDFRALKLAARLLRRCEPAVAFIHDCFPQRPVRRFIERHVPHAFFADAAGFVAQYGHLDRDEAGASKGLACIPHRERFPDAALRARLMLARWWHSLRRSGAKRLGNAGR